jgi:hypothetical protein
VFCNYNNDFYIEIDKKISILDEVIFIKNGNSMTIKNIVLQNPFEHCDLSLNPESAIISTMCKDYSSRLEEWIDYNLNLGFSGIVIFDNDSNKSTKLNEELEYCHYNGTTEDICNKYKGKVWRVELKYEPFHGAHWNNIQRISLNMGVHAFRNKCGKIALIDADEFIHIPNCPNIMDFFSNYKGQTLTIRSNILTNQSNQDIINNNILDLCVYVGENMHTKTILDTRKINRLEFIITPHIHPTELMMNKEQIIHYHCWVNARYSYHINMPKIDFLKKSLNIVP